MAHSSTNSPLNTIFTQQRGHYSYRGLKNPENSCKFFQKTLVEDCSYVKVVKSYFRPYEAVPFYTPSPQRKRSLSPVISQTTETFRNPRVLSAGMGAKKPLIPYNPEAQRSKLYSSQDSRYFGNRSSSIEIGCQRERSNEWKTTYQKSFPQKQSSSKFTNNPAIQSYRVKWDWKMQRKP